MGGGRDGGLAAQQFNGREQCRGKAGREAFWRRQKISQVFGIFCDFLILF
jgi:hypothetical protein